MAASTVLRLIFTSNNQASAAIKQLNNDLSKQREELARLRTVENARNAEANVALVQQRNQLRVSQAAQAARQAELQAGAVQQREQLRLVQATERARASEVQAQLAQRRVSVAARNAQRSRTPARALAYEVALEQERRAVFRAAQAQESLARLQVSSQNATAKAAQQNIVAQQRLALVQQQAAAANVRAVRQNAIAQQSLANIQKGNNEAVSTGIGLLTRLGSAGAIAAGAAAAAFAGLSVAVFGLAQGLQQAADLEVRQTQVASTLIRVLGVGRIEANELVQSTISQILEIGQGSVDTTLAVRISDVVLDEVAIGVQQTGGSQADITRLGAELSARLASSLTGQEERFGELQNVLSDILQGSQSIDQLQGRDILNDIGLNRVLIPLLRQRGVDNVADLSNFDRIEVLLEALRITESDDNLLARANTVRGQFALFLNKLFNPYTGLFGVNRDLDPQVAGSQSVFEAFKAVTIALIGRNGVFDNAARALSATGFEFDFLESVRNGLISFNDFLVDLNRFLINIRDSSFVKFLREANERAQGQSDRLGVGNPTQVETRSPLRDLLQGGANPNPLGRSTPTQPIGAPTIAPVLLPRLGPSTPAFNISKGAITVIASPTQTASDVAEEVLKKMDGFLGAELAGIGGFI